MKHKSLIAYFVILFVLCAGFVIGAKMLGEQGMYLAQGYMLTPALSYVFSTLFGAIQWDFTGNEFLRRLAEQFAAAGQDMKASLPPGFTPQMMLMIFFVGGLTVFNILPGIITGFGEEFGHRGFMFPALYRIKPWVGILIGGLIWYAWHWPVMLIVRRPPRFRFGRRF